MSVGDASGVSRAAGNLGTIYLDGERFDEAEQEFMLALDAAREAGEQRGVAMQMRNLGALAHRRGRADEACARLKESLAICLAANAETEAVEVKVLMGEYGCGQAAAVEPDEEKPDEEKQRA
jgi:Tfp pilus assembly protein PilF